MLQAQPVRVCTLRRLNVRIGASKTAATDRRGAENRPVPFLSFVCLAEEEQESRIGLLREGCASECGAVVG